MTERLLENDGRQVTTASVWSRVLQVTSTWNKKTDDETRARKERFHNHKNWFKLYRLLPLSPPSLPHQ
jgi:hypothetical protein